MVRLFAKDFKKAGEDYVWLANGRTGKLPSGSGAPDDGVLFDDRIVVLLVGEARQVVCFSPEGEVLWKITALPQMEDPRLEPAGIGVDHEGRLLVGNWAGHVHIVNPDNGELVYWGFAK